MRVGRALRLVTELACARELVRPWVRSIGGFHNQRIARMALQSPFFNNHKREPEVHNLRGAEWAGGMPMAGGDALFSGFYLKKEILKMLNSTVKLNMHKILSMLLYLDVFLTSVLLFVLDLSILSLLHLFLNLLFPSLSGLDDIHLAWSSQDFEDVLHMWQ